MNLDDVRNAVPGDAKSKLLTVLSDSDHKGMLTAKQQQLLVKSFHRISLCYCRLLPVICSSIEREFPIRLLMSAEVVLPILQLVVHLLSFFSLKFFSKIFYEGLMCDLFRFLE